MEFTKAQEIECIASLEPINTEKEYEQMLDECYPEIEICGLKYSPSQCQKEIDPTAYRCGLNDYIDCQCKDDTWIEIRGDFYNYDAVQSVLDQIEQMESEKE